MIKKNNLVLTINIGNRNFIKYTGVFMKKYAEKTGSDFIIIDESNLYNIIEGYDISAFRLGRGNNKAYLYKILSIMYYLNIYHNVLWVDDTCFIKDNCDDLFLKINSKVDILAYNEGEKDCLSSWKYDLKFIKKSINYSINRMNYINSGLVLYTDKINKYFNKDNIYKFKKLLLSDYPCQAYTSFIIDRFNIQLCPLSSSYNCMFMNCEYNNNGRNIEPSSIGKEFVLSNENKIFHITGFYKNRIEIIFYIFNMYNDSNLFVDDIHL